MPKKYLTQEGLEKLKKELEYLKTVRRKELADQLERAIAFGDISENSEFQEAKEAQAFMEGRILELEDILRSADVLSINQGAKKIVAVGSVVFVDSGKEKEKFHIVSAEEASPMDGKISFVSPLGSALIDRPKGATVIVDTPQGKRRYKILKIE